MEEDKYLIKDYKGNIVAEKMNLQNALIVCKGLFETYYLEADISFSIVRMQEIKSKSDK